MLEGWSWQCGCGRGTHLCSGVLVPCTQRYRLPPLEQGREPDKERKKEERILRAQQHQSLKVTQSTLSAVLKRGPQVSFLPARLSLEGNRLAVSTCPQITPLLCWVEGCWAPPSELPTVHGLALTWVSPLAVFILKRLPNTFIKLFRPTLLPLRLYQEKKKIGDSQLCGHLASSSLTLGCGGDLVLSF